MTGRRRRSNRLRAIERALYAIGLVALTWYLGARMAAAREQSALAGELERAAHGADRTAGRLATGALVGRIQLSRLNLSVFAREGVDTRTLRGAAGHVPGSALPGESGNAAFAAHRDTFFRPLEGVRKGDVIAVTTPQGRFRYVVSATRVVDPSDVWVLRASSHPTLTLVTCYPFEYVGSAPQRFVVTARLVHSKPRA